MIIPKRNGLLLVIGAALVMGAISQQAAENPDGAEIFRAQCSMCHGVEGKGYSAIKTPDFTDSKWQAAHGDKELLDAIENGVPDTAMVAFKGKLSHEQIEAMLKYIRSLSGKKNK